MFRNRGNRVHFVGVGGIGMSGIAEVLVNLGFDVRGSDLQRSSVTTHLEAHGLTLFLGHATENVGDADVVVVSSAIKVGNPEVDEARRRGIPVIPRAEMLAELMRLKYGVAVAGAHGKTTTTSLIATIMARGSVDPTIVIGGRLRSIRSNAKLGDGEYLVAEADESDGSFLHLIPTIAVVTNIDLEHLDHWTGGLAEITDAFQRFVNKVPFYGLAVLCLDHPTVQQLLPNVDKRMVTYGFSAQADYVAENVRSSEGSMQFSLRVKGETRGDVSLRMIGRHNVLNALAAIAVADEVEIPWSVTTDALASFEGIGRRFEIKGERNDVVVVDDYGHHPTEIRATLEAARDAYDRRLVVAFEPHRYSRTRDLLQEFGSAFNACHLLFVSDVFAAGEEPIEGIDSNRLVDVIRGHGHHAVHYAGSLQGLSAQLKDHIQPGDLVLTMGAGRVWQVGEELVDYLNRTNPTDGKGEQDGS